VVGLVWSGVSSLLYDDTTDRAFRGANSAAIEAAEVISGDVLVITWLSFHFLPQLRRAGSYVANVNPDSGGRADRGLIDHHLRAGRRVFVDGLIAEAILKDLGEPRYVTREVSFATRTLIELSPVRMPGGA
jgi:hypothetical protein